MSQNPFFSVIIPVYNRSEILRETIGSVQAQGFNNWEVIIVDDGSTDNTGEIAKELIQADPRIRYVFQENAERSAARNHGAEVAEGNYLFFLDSDDAFVPNHFETLHRLLEEKEFPVCMVIANHVFLKEDGKETPVVPKMMEGDEFNYVLSQPITPSRVCIHRKILEKFKFDPRIVIVEDLVLWTCIASEFPVYQSELHTVLYRLHEGNSIDLSRNSYKKRYDGLQLFFSDEKYKPVTNRITKEKQQFLLAECSFNMARHFEFIGDFSKMNSMLWQSYQHLPDYRNKERIYMFLKHFSLTAPFIKLHSGK
ncbi:MAG: glycosyltransferase family 2 protein [Bacteroidia bacterium]